MDLSKKYLKVSEKTILGVPVDIDGTKFILTYYNASVAQVHFNTELAKLIAVGRIPEEAAVDAMRSTLSGFIVLGWEDLQEDGVDVPYSVETCVRILSEYIGLDTKLMEESIHIKNFREAAIEETKEKLGK